MRSVIGIVILTLIHGPEEMYSFLYSSIDLASVPALSLQVVTTSFAIFATLYCVKYFDLTIIVMVLNSAPLLTTPLSSLMLNESISKVETIRLLLAFIGILLMILGGESEEKRAQY